MATNKVAGIEKLEERERLLYVLGWIDALELTLLVCQSVLPHRLIKINIKIRSIIIIIHVFFIY